jgi:hypothetical protein
MVSKEAECRDLEMEGQPNLRAKWTEMMFLLRILGPA